MAAIDFPNNPQIDDIHIHEELAWSWDGVSWKRLFEDHNFSSKIGIGTTAPQEEIHIKSVTPVIRIEDIDGGYMQIVGNDGSIRFDADNTNSIADTNVRFIIDGSEKFRIDSDGKVGIGTTTPSSPLHIKSNDNLIMSLQSADANVGNVYFNFRDNSGNEKGWVGYGSASTDTFGIYNNRSANINLATAGILRMSIDSSGNVDIGNSSSNVELKVNDHKVYHEGNLEIDTAIVFSTAMQDTPEQKWVSFTIPHIGGSGTSNYYYFDVYGYSDIGTMDSQLHYRLYIHVRADGTNENAINIKPLLIMDDPLDGPTEWDNNTEEGFNFYYTQTSVTDSKVWIHLPEDYSALDILSSKLESGGLSPAISSMFAETTTQPSGLISVPIIESLRTEGFTTYIKGKVGIGTSIPSRTLELVDVTNDGSGGLKVRSYLPVIELQDSSGGVTNSKIQLDGLNMKIGPTTSSTYLTLNTEDTERMRIDRYGNVGIGTTSPTNKLSVNGRADFDRIVLTNAYQAGTENWIISTGDTGTIAGSSGYTHNGGIGLFANATYHSSGNFSLQDTSKLSASAISVQDDGHIRFAAVDGLSSTTNVTLLASYTRMTIEPSGSVGIGTSVPQEKLDVYGNIKLGSHTNDGVIRAWTSRGTDEGGNSTNGSNLILKAGIGTGSGTNGQIEFHTEHSTLNYGNGSPHGSGSAKMVIDSDGNVGIGTTPSAKLQISGDKDATNLIVGAPLHTVNGGGLADYSEILFDNNYVTGSSGTAYIRHYANSHQNSEGALYFGITSSTGTTSSALAIRGTGETYSYNDIRISKSFPKLIIDSPSTSTAGDDWTTEGAMIVLGESADDGSGSGTAALYLTYNGNGNSYIGTGGVNTSTGIPNQGYINFPYNNDRINLIADKVGIGTTTPSAKLHVSTPGYSFDPHNTNPVASLVVGFGSQALGHGCNSIGYQAVSGKDDGDGTFSGNFSVALGYQTLASGGSSTAIGDNTTASGVVSTAMGYNTTASGGYSLSSGYNSSASQDYSIAMGNNSNASKENAIAIGYYSVSSGLGSVSLGYSSDATGNYSTALGRDNTASAEYSFASGYSSDATGYASVAIGWNTSATTNGAVAIGYGADATGAYSTAFGDTVASGVASTAMGNNTEANGHYSTAMGFRMNVDGNYSFGISLNNPSTDYELTQANTMAIMGGNVGIGETTPTTKLGILGSPYVLTNSGKSVGGIHLRTENLRSNGEYTNAISFSHQNHTASSSISGVVTGGDGDNLGLSFITHPSSTGADDAVEAMRINHLGNVGIGTTSPNSLLHIHYPDYDSSIHKGDANPVKAFQIGEGSNVLSHGGIAMGQDCVAGNASFTSIGQFAIAMGEASTASGMNSIAMGKSVTASGNSSFACGLHSQANGHGSTAIGGARVNGHGASGIGTNIYVNGDDSVGIGLMGAGQTSYTLSNPNIMAIMGGNVGIGTVTPSQVLHVSGNILASGTVTQNSDITLKENLEVIQDPIQKVKQINGYTFNMIDNQEEKMVGLVAQEVEEILPELISEDNEGIKSLAYGNMVALLVECIKKQDERIESQDERIKNLEKIIQELS